jgi:hypothetical protein
MKRIILLLCLASMMFAIKQVPRQTSSAENNESQIRVEAKQETKSQSDIQGKRTTKTSSIEKRERQQDQFQDKNSNGVNDRREDDFQNIKTKKSKHRDLIDRKDVKRIETKPKVETKQRERTPSKPAQKTTSKEQDMKRESSNKEKKKGK